MGKRRSSHPRRPTSSNPVEDVAKPDLDAALRTVLGLLEIPGPSGDEQGVVDAIVRALRKAGAPASTIKTDRVFRKSHLPGAAGNLVLKLPGTRRGRRRLLMAHVDTVPLCVGCRPRHSGRFIRSADSQTALGGDNRAGSAVLLNTAVELLTRDLPHPPLTFLWTVQEEVGLCGARHVNLGLLGRPHLAFNWDGGATEKITIGATGAYRLDIDVTGVASHAGAHPELGVSAVAAAGLAIADLHRNRWHGAIRKGRQTGTSNIGYVRGGEATNVVTDHVKLRAEARSHDAGFRREIVRAIERAFRSAARAVRSEDGKTAKVKIASRLDYEAFCLEPDDPSVVAAGAAIRSIGKEPLRVIANGGLDANWLTARGIPTVTLGCGQQYIHTVRERLDVTEFRKACHIALRLTTLSVA